MLCATAVITLSSKEIDMKEMFAQAKPYMFTALCVVTAICTFAVGGFIFAGFFMGLVTSIALFMSIRKLPAKIQRFMARHPFISDMVCLKLTAGILMLIGTGPTIFMALVTQMVVMGILLETLDPNMKDSKESWKRQRQSTGRVLTLSPESVTVVPQPA